MTTTKDNYRHEIIKITSPLSAKVGELRRLGAELLQEIGRVENELMEMRFDEEN